MLVRLVACLNACIAALLVTASPAQAQPVATTEPPRPGYLLVMGTSTDAAAMGRYARTLPPIYDQYGGYYLAAGGLGRGLKVLEGDFKAQSVILAKFPKGDGPNEFWWSPEYRSSVEIRRGAGAFDVIKLRGLPGDTDRPAGQPAYLISIAAIRDRSKLQPYAAVAMPLVRAAGARFISTGGRKDIELLEGDFGNLSVTVLQFPSMAALEKFYSDPAYQKVIPVRQSAGEYVVLAIDGFVPRN